MTTQNIKTIEIRTGLLLFVSNTLNTLELDIPQSSARRRFLRNIKTYLESREAVRQELLSKHGEKEGDKSRILNNEVVFTAANRKIFNEGMDKVDEEKVVLDVLPSNEKDIQTVNVILKEVGDKVEKEANGKYGAQTFEFLELLKEALELIK